MQSIRNAVEKLQRVSISLEPSETQPLGELESRSQSDVLSGEGGLHWLELLCDGLTFDLTGLAPGRSATPPEIRNRLDLPDDFRESTGEPRCILPGPHLSGGINSIPVVRVMFILIAELASTIPAVCAIFWPPSGTMIGPEFFRATAESWDAGGAFPAQVLTAFKRMNDGGLQSEGLAFFTGQEIRIEPGSVGDHSTATQLAGRLVQQLVQHGPLSQTEEVMAPDGSQMRLEPSGNGKFVRVWRS